MEKMQLPAMIKVAYTSKSIEVVHTATGNTIKENRTAYQVSANQGQPCNWKGQQKGCLPTERIK